MSYTEQNQGKYSAGKMIGSVLPMAGGYFLSQYLGAMIWAPVIVGLISAFILNKTLPPRNHIAVPALSVMIGHLGWLGLGAIVVPGAAMQLIPDIAIFGALAIWFAIKPTKLCAIILILLEVISMGINLFAMSKIPFGLLQSKALLIHVAIRILVIVLLGIFIAKRYGDNDVVPQAELEDIFS